MAGVTGEPPPLRPFPALDPEPPRRFTWRSVRWTALGCVIAGAVTAIVLVTWPASSPSVVQAHFTDGEGLVVFEQQPSGALGTAAPDGSHRVMLARIGTLQGTDLPVASSDGRYLVNQEGQLVAMGPAGPAVITSLPQPAQTQNSGFSWQSASFADGSKYVEATGCYWNNATSTQSWVADLIPASGGQGHVLGTVTDSVGDPQNAAAIESTPASPQAASSPFQCGGPAVPDKALQLDEPGQAPRTIVTAGKLDRVLGVPAGTPVELNPSPAPDGRLLALNVVVGAPATAAAYLAARQETIVITRTGTVVAQAPLRAGELTKWSPDGRQIASCRYPRRTTAQRAVTIWTVGGATRTITLPGHDFGCNQLLWSPDGHQLLYAARVTNTGLTASDDLQRGWTVIDLRTGQAHDVTAPGQPAAWLATTPGGTR